MKTHILRILFLAVTLLHGVLYAQTNPNHVYVNGYTKSNGTYVAPHYRTAPNSTNRDNFSTVGNTNPYTGVAGWIPADNNPLPSTNTSSTYDGGDIFNAPITSPRPGNSNAAKLKEHISDYNYAVPPTNGITYYTTTDLRLRIGPSKEDEIVLTMPEGASVEVVNDFDSWAYVYYAGYYGYASAVYLSSTPIQKKTVKQFRNNAVPKTTYTSYNSSYNSNAWPPTSGGSGESYSASAAGKVFVCISGLGIGFWLLRKLVA